MTQNSSEILAIASSNLFAGNLVNLFYTTNNSISGIYARLASANANTTYPAVGYVTNNANAGDIVTVYPSGITTIPNTSNFSYNDIGSTLYLSDNIDGTTTKIAPTSPNLTQSVGFITNLENNPVTSFDLYFNPTILTTTNSSPTNANVIPTTTLSVTAPNAGNFSINHGLNTSPNWIDILMTSNGSMWARTPVFDSANINLVSSDANITSIIYVF